MAETLGETALRARGGAEETGAEEEEQVDKRRNFYILQLAGHTYTVFPGGGTVVVTGIPNESRIGEAVRQLSLALGHAAPGVGRGEWNETVTNSTYSGGGWGEEERRRPFAARS